MEAKNEHDIAMETEMEEFLRKTDFKDSYPAILRNMNSGSKSGACRYQINLDDVRQKSPKLAKYIIQEPSKAIKMFEDKANKIIEDLDSSLSNEKMRANESKMFPTKQPTLRLTFEGNLGKNFVTPRGLKANMLNSLVRVQGIVTRMSIVKPKLEKSYHYIPATNQGYVQNYKDQYCVEGQGNYSSKMFPTKDAAGNPMTADYGYCNYTNVQKIVIQEMPERAPTGQIPRSVTIFLQDDLVDKVKPGDRVEVTGVFKCTAGQSSQTSGVFRSVIIGTGVNTISDRTEKIKFTNEDIQNIKKIADRKDVFELLAASVAPTVQGHRNIKKSMLLQLLGGNEKNLHTGTHLRGDINILLIGDPSTAKSQMLRHAMNLAPISINTTGRGSSGVGLTAAVSVDKETGEKHLEAGAMVLADRGLVCIDEFDKMDDSDRVAIHEVMEQQTVTIAKAGIHASLNARCSVVAAANPIYGDYDWSIPAAKNIGLPDTLLSRFDLLFVVLDKKDPVVDKRIAERVIRNHSYKDGNKDSILNLFQDDFFIEPEIMNDDELDKETQVYEKSNPILYGNIDYDIVTTSFLKKYIAFAKKAPTPMLSEDALDFITQAYKTLRQKGQDVEFANQKKLPVTVRTLETLIRLGSAHSKLRVNNAGVITTDDLQEGLKLMNYAIFDEDDDDEGGLQGVDYLTKQEYQPTLEESKLGSRIMAATNIKTERQMKTSRDAPGTHIHDPEEEKVQIRKVRQKKVKVDETEKVKNLIDFSANSEEDVALRKKRKCIYNILVSEQAKNKFEVTLAELWDIVCSEDEHKDHIGSKEEMLQIVHGLENTHQVILTDQNTVALI